MIAKHNIIGIVRPINQPKQRINQLDQPEGPKRINQNDGLPIDQDKSGILFIMVISKIDIRSTS